MMNPSKAPGQLPPRPERPQRPDGGFENAEQMSAFRQQVGDWRNQMHDWRDQRRDQRRSPMWSSSPERPWQGQAAPPMMAGFQAAPQQQLALPAQAAPQAQAVAQPMNTMQQAWQAMGGPASRAVLGAPAAQPAMSKDQLMAMYLQNGGLPRAGV